MNEKWQRWITASVNKHFDSNRNSLLLMYEGVDDGVTDEVTEAAELRLDGPIFEEQSKGCFRIDVHIGVGIAVKDDGKNSYKLQVNCGIFTKAFTKCISVYQYGDGDALLGVLELYTDVSVSHYGKPDPDLPFQEAQITAAYRMYLEE